MLRRLLVLLALPMASAALADAVTVQATINLNQPGALESLQRDDPRHYATVRQILDDVFRHPYPDYRIAGWVAANYNAKDVHYGPVLLATAPPQRDLSFVLDEVRYRARLWLTGGQVRMQPAR